ncbi:MAG: DUF2510 domain-containing protein [Ilumatobacteraceae bacterium]
MTVAAFWIGWLVIWPTVCALIAQSRGMEWWVGALLGLLGCVGLVIVLVMRPGGGPTPHLPPPPPGAQWAPDPTGRHQLRLWDGRQWTPNVSNGGVSGWDPIPGGG